MNMHVEVSSVVVPGMTEAAIRDAFFDMEPAARTAHDLTAAAGRLVDTIRADGDMTAAAHRELTATLAAIRAETAKLHGAYADGDE